jgi:hypothetical protein
MAWTGLFSSFAKHTPPVNVEASRLPHPASACEEKRRDTRAEIEILVTATTRDGRRFQAYSRDLSQNGSALIVWGELALGEKVSLAYRFPNATEEIVVPAVVRHSIEHRYGMEFSGDDHQQVESQVLRICRAAASELSPSANAN